MTAGGVLAVANGSSLWDASRLNSDSRLAPPDRAPVLDPDRLAGVEDKAPVRRVDQNYYEATAYTYVLTEAHKTSAQAFAKSARTDLSFAHLFEEPEKYRGQVVHIEGRLLRLHKFDAPQLAAREGVPVLYEGWVFGDTYFSNPYCVIVTDVPEWMKPGDRTDYPVAFDGYFFKRYRYKAGDGLRDAPLLIGRTFVERSYPLTPESTGAFTGALLPLFLALLVGTALLVIGLGWWFRRGDRQVRARLSSARETFFDYTE
jgi:hypothetical protein